MKAEKINLLRNIRTYFDDKDLNALKDLINKLDTFVVADIIEVLEPEEQVTVLRLLSKERALEVFEHIEAYVQQSLLQSFTDENAIEYFEALEPDDRIKLMEELPAGIAKKLLDSLTHSEREMTSLLLGYKPGTAGQIMTPKYIRLMRSMTVNEAIEKVRESGKDLETVNLLYVTDEKRILEGVVSLSEIIMAQPENLISDIMRKEPLKVNTEMDEERVAFLLKESDLIALPVVDLEDRLVGVVTIDDAIDILEDQATDAAFDKAGFLELNRMEKDRSRVLIDGSVFDVWRVRIPFLIITLLGGMLAGGLISYFEETLRAIVAVAFFVPVIMDMGGNVGTQSSTIFTRALLLGQIDFKKFIKYWLREIFIGFTVGAFLGTAGGLAVFLWQGTVILGLVVGASLCITIIFATALGFFVPFVLVKFGFDQAAGADPIITTIIDIVGLGIYFSLVRLFLF